MIINTKTMESPKENENSCFSSSSSSSSSSMEVQSLVWNPILGIVDSMAIKAAIDLQIPDILVRHHGELPISLPDLISRLPLPCSNPSSLLRLLRYLSHLRLITTLPSNPPSFSPTPSTPLLLSLSPYASFRLNAHYLPPLCDLSRCITTHDASPPFQLDAGESLWAHAARDGGLFHRGMGAVAGAAARGLLEKCCGVFDGVGTVVDVGGGTGTAARAIKERFPSVRCVVMDLEHVVEEAVRRSGGDDGVEFLAGDMFVAVPPADVVMLMWILHDWRDEKCLQILEKCREAIPENGGKIIIVDAVIDDEQEPELNHARMAFDMVMMAYTGGRERDEKEWKDLLMAAGFVDYKITPIMALQHVIEVHL